METPPIEIFYDGRCRWCVKGTRRLKRLDWLNRLRAVDYQSLDEGDRPVEYGVFDRGMPVRTRSGGVLIGYDGVRYAFVHTPLGWIVGWVLYLPGISHLGRWAYRWLAEHRPGRDVCHVDPTATPPPRSSSDGNA